MVERGLSERRGCALLQISRANDRYVAHPRDDGPLAARLRQIVQTYPRYGYRRAWALLVRAGATINSIKVYRVWKKEGLARPGKRRKPRRSQRGSVPLQALHPNHV